METIHWKKKDRADSLKTVTREGVTYLAFPALEETGLVAHGFPPGWEEGARGHFPP